jgi:hypothetical protein
MSATTRPDPRLRMLRYLLATVVGLDLVALAFFVLEARERAGEAATGVVALASATPVPFVIAAIGLAGAVLFARRSGQLTGAAVALVALAVLSHVHAALFGSPWRHLYFSGACLLGWLAGIVFARVRGAPEDERYARVGAIAVLGAAYFSSGLSKLVYGGLAWANGLTLRHAIITQDGLLGAGWLPSLRLEIVESPVIGAILGTLTIAFELGGAAFLVGPRVRTVIALGIVGMHTSILVLTGILYAESMVLLLAFGLPFVKDDPARDIAPLPSRAAWWTSLALFAVAALGVAREAAATVGEPSGGPDAISVDVVGPFRVGETLAGWTLSRAEVSGETITLSFERRGTSAVFDLTCHEIGHTSPFDDGEAHVLYRQASLARDEVAPLGNAIREASRGAGSGRDACAAWADWRASAR